LPPAAAPELDDPPHPATANPAAIATTAAVPARPRGLTALRLMFLVSLALGLTA